MEDEGLVQEYLEDFSNDADEWFKEATFLEERFNFFSEFFKEEHLLKLEWDEVQKLGDNLHCFATNALAKKRAFGKMNHDIEHYRSSLHYLAYGDEDPRTRIDALSDKDGKYRLKYIADSAISELIGYIMPDKYTIFNSRSRKALSLLGIEVKKKRKETLGDQFENFSEAIIPLTELYLKIVGKKTKLPLSFEIDQFLSYLADSYEDDEEEVTDGVNEETNFWVFQGNPNVYDVSRSLSDNMVHEWWVKSHKDKINIGDKGIIWVTGKESGCYAFFKVTTEIYEKGEDENQEQYYHTEMKHDVGSKIGIEIEKNISKIPVLKETVKKLDWFQNFKGGNQGTTFQMTRKEYEGFLTMTENNNKSRHWMIACGHGGEFWEEFKSLNRISIGWKKLGDHRKFKARDEIEPEYMDIYKPEKRPTNNTLCIWEFSNEIKKGDIVFVKKGRTQFLAAGRVTSEEVGYDGDKSDHQMYHSVEWLKIQDHELDDGGVALKSLTNIDRYTDFVKKLRAIYGLEEEALNISKGNNVMKNQIFYGPPGTGKTMTILDLREKYTSKGQADSRDDIIVKIVKSMSWWECIACVLADLGGWVKVVDIKEHPIIKAKLEIQNNKSINNTLWGQLQSHTALDNKFVNTREDKRMEPLIFEKDENSKWCLVQEWKEMVPDIREIAEKISRGQTEGDDEERYKLVTFHPNFTYEDFMLGIRPDTDDAEGIRYEKVPGKFKEICDMARKHKDKDFAIFIDEINRGNIPAIFGELITLIEDDKRDILIDIPNSDEKFSVPENLWIYGTMNTADRSVESLDIALRRRFSFIPLYPDPGVLKNKMVGNINLQTLLEKMNERIEFLKDKDHTIGHSYFLDIENLNDLKICFENKVIPLLEEYFYNDFEKIGLVLGKSFVKPNNKHKQNKHFFADFDSEFKDDLDEYDVYEFVKVKNLKEEAFVSIYEKK
jgi:hypothetical protein